MNPKRKRKKPITLAEIRRRRRLAGHPEPTDEQKKEVSRTLGDIK